MRFLLVFLVTAALAGCAGSTEAPEPLIQPSGPFTVERMTLRGPDGQTVPLDLWLADSPEERALGLMHRTELPDGAGMLFVFEADTDSAFWMKNTLIPLSIGFFSVDGELLRVLDMAPCAADPCPMYEPGVTYRRALEVPGGWFARHGVREGWRLGA